jgi:hypothetical protein
MPPSKPFPAESARLSLSGRRDPMVNGKQRKFQAIGNPCFVIYAVQLVLDHLFDGAQPQRNLFVLAPCTIRATILVSLGVSRSRSRVAGSKARYHLNMCLEFTPVRSRHQRNASGSNSRAYRPEPPGSG